MAKPGQPTKYDPKYVEELIKYFDIEPHYETPVVITDKNGISREEVKLLPSDLPTLAGFAVKIGVHRDTLHQWSQDHPAFSDAIKKAKECQERILITNGLHGNYNNAFAIFTAKNLLRWTDKHEITGDNGGPINFSFIVGNGFDPGANLPRLEPAAATPAGSLTGGAPALQDPDMAQTSS